MSRVVSAVVVVRVKYDNGNTEQKIHTIEVEGDPKRHYSGKNSVLSRALLVMYKAACTREKFVWTTEMDTYLNLYYPSTPKAVLARHLAAMSGQPITKNSVISRYNKKLKGHIT